MEAERRSVKLKQIQFLHDRLGEEFHAVISGVANYGIFVELTDILAEGLIRARDLEGDFYVLDEKKYSLIGRRTKKQFRLGDKITVKLVRVDIDNLELDFVTSNNEPKLMIKSIIKIFFLVFIVQLSLFAQFGKNKVQYKIF